MSSCFVLPCQARRLILDNASIFFRQPETLTVIASRAVSTARNDDFYFKQVQRTIETFNYSLLAAYINPFHLNSVIQIGAVTIENSVVIPIILAAALLLPPIASTITKAAAATGVALIKNSTPNTVVGKCNAKPTTIAKSGDTVTRRMLAHSEKSLILNKDLKSKDAPTQINAQGRAVADK